MWQILSRVHESVLNRYTSLSQNLSGRLFALAEKRRNETIYRKLFMIGRFERNLEKPYVKGSQIDA